MKQSTDPKMTPMYRPRKPPTINATCFKEELIIQGNKTQGKTIFTPDLKKTF